VNDDGALSRAAAARAVGLVLDPGVTLEVALGDERVRSLSDARAQIQALSFGTVRFAIRLRAALAPLTREPFDTQPPELQALLLLGAWQLSYGGLPPHAAVSTVVEATRRLGHARAAGFINAILRRFDREREACFARADRELASRYAHPAWLVERLASAQGACAEAVLAANNAPPPLTLRVNRRRASVDALAQRLLAEGHALRRPPLAPDALTLEHPVDVRSLAAFREGLVSVQDAAAQLAAPLLAAAPGARVLDACAAPGGKACHLLEIEPGLSLLALEKDERRAPRLRENLARLGLAAELRVADAGEPSAWWDGRPFDRILIDAPCSGTGVIRRHPDIKLLRRREDLAHYAREQQRLLAALWPLLAPGGRLLYATCSILAEENEDVIRGFLARARGAVECTESARLAVPALPAPVAGPGVLLLPGAADTDGFYYACIEKA
jgi:16S rRNA (cytosine967-C5)-methyltransferase